MKPQEIKTLFKNATETTALGSILVALRNSGAGRGIADMIAGRSAVEIVSDYATGLELDELTMTDDEMSTLREICAHAETLMTEDEAIELAGEIIGCGRDGVDRDDWYDMTREEVEKLALELKISV